MIQEETKDQNFQNTQTEENQMNVENTENVTDNNISENDETSGNAQLSENEMLKTEVGELKDKYIRLYSEFDNFRRRTSKEKMEFFKTANEDLMNSLLPVLDDFERAQKAMKPAENNEAITEGINLIQSKLFKTLEGKGLKIMDTNVGSEFNSELHEAITQSPAPSPELKGKVIDVLEKGYYLNEKVIRFAKVIIGS